ncbi:hypothetical protein HMN09_00278000 [Mycena chlorophos]|uniref:Uncharacterized protein n=1 Tax=Mycena chlorophos TaxID=658473 RepID=A0A8H6TI77_MYCCL|nr:hypothetical protein HMN09_00278000 [Mycena chlorophos]
MPFHLPHRRRTAEGASPSKDSGRRIDKAAIGPPILLSLPRRFEIYAGDGPAGPGVNSPFPIRDPEAPYPIIRSYSLPTPSPSPISDGPEVAVSAPPAARANSHSPLHVETFRRPLSPIQEQSYISPVSPVADSEISTLELSSRAPPKVERISGKQDPPTIPPLSFGPYFPGPHPSQDGVGPPRRPPKAHTAPVRNSIFSAAAGSDSGSLHAESFVTAKSVHFEDEFPDIPDDAEAGPAAINPAPSSTNNVACSPHPGQPLDRTGTFGSSTSTAVGSSLRRRRQRLAFATPAFCMFCLGFLLPPCWWIGGWYFTFFTEAPASRTMWEHYVVRTRWWALLTCGFGVTRTARDASTSADALDDRNPGLAARRPKTLLLPRWVRNPSQTPALDGIAYYYPFVSRPSPKYITTGPPPRGFGFLHAYFDDMTRSRLRAVKLARETPRRIIDPWIGRCRRALCYWALVIVLVALGMMGWSFAVGAGKSKF